MSDDPRAVPLPNKANDPRIEPGRPLDGRPVAGVRPTRLGPVSGPPGESGNPPRRTKPTSPFLRLKFLVENGLHCELRVEIRAGGGDPSTWENGSAARRPVPTPRRFFDTGAPVQCWKGPGVSAVGGAGAGEGGGVATGDATSGAGGCWLSSTPTARSSEARALPSSASTWATWSSTWSTSRQAVISGHVVDVPRPVVAAGELERLLALGRMLSRSRARTSRWALAWAIRSLISP